MQHSQERDISDLNGGDARQGQRQMNTNARQHDQQSRRHDHQTHHHRADLAQSLPQQVRPQRGKGRIGRCVDQGQHGYQPENDQHNRDQFIDPGRTMMQHPTHAIRVEPRVILRFSVGINFFARRWRWRSFFFYQLGRIWIAHPFGGGRRGTRRCWRGPGRCRRLALGF